ncbi:aminoglycoside phosphotransferase [Alkalihalobacillus alcalophilus ATCC 27647 = CGMCC 1.3604]|uniref:Aminoglycoside phosphotransferase n=1 Tax=Alkalihalobacillus alcalophilus ATCC 27647 = CGMCC 1.3604 TaxID=1218173 RepID=A0A094WJC2_ALKAL|nr:aminoglycoside phosphotransferase family protein [Alkalihalobacillus alcalophilus]KGA96936.1 aminoglycoside phosphotransferase [Alkalihalobacillus alcalophilus ATCC 27647 = CGMCC 1.3604]MED1562290.1 aminoglycoside phosphotransferase family protein [Alkalihalobacillus alcalophilus]THG88808.1 aminoglycoside phosphotransferase [Alkalihalobacillus alcalophilus ATCC 27647 = CGMCC 1.3604]
MNLIATGNTAKIYLHENKIIKIYNDKLPETESIHEANKQKWAYSFGLSVPKILDVTKIEGKQAIIMEYSKGKTLGELLLENKDQAEYYMNLSIDMQQQIHSVVPNTTLELMTEKLQHQIQTVSILEKKQQDMLIKKLHSITFDKRLCHGDFHLFNLIKTDNKVTIIDWVDSSVGDIRADVYRTYLLYSYFSLELAEMYCRLYCERSGLSKIEVFQWAPIIAAARLAENVRSESSERLLEIVNQFCPL